jgi:hypothetical protein
LLVRAIDMRHRKTALKSYLTTLRAMQLQRTRTIDISESAAETSSDTGTGSRTLRPLAPGPLRPSIVRRQSHCSCH